MDNFWSGQYVGEEDEDIMFSPALLARRASESWIDTPPAEPVPVPARVERKKSLPGSDNLAGAVGAAMSREEVSMLSSARREEVRRNAEMSARYKANPMLYLVSPQVKEWVSRQQLVMLVLFVNISLAIMFFKLLT